MAMDDRFAPILTDPRFKVSKIFFAESFCGILNKNI